MPVCDGAPCFRTVLRLAPTRAGTPLWFLDCPVLLDESWLTPPLKQALRSWEDEYLRNAQTLGMPWVETAWLLAQRLAVEIGDDFIIQVDATLLGSRRRQVRSNRPASNQGAATTFRRIAKQVEEQRRAILGHHYNSVDSTPWHDAVKVLPDIPDLRRA